MYTEKDWVSQLFPELEQLATDQERVADDYSKRFFLTEKEGAALHMFFSPTRVPEGLTEGEVRIVLLLYDLRNAHRSKEVGTVFAYDLNAVIGKMMLPRELLFSEGQMTRERFKAGVWKYLQQVAVATIKEKVFAGERPDPMLE